VSTGSRGKIFLDFLEIRAQGLQCGEPFDEHDRKRQARGDGLNRRAFVDVFQPQAGECGDSCAIVGDSENRIDLMHFAEDLADFVGVKSDWNFSDFEIEKDFLSFIGGGFVRRGLQIAQHRGRTECGMPRRMEFPVSGVKIRTLKPCSRSMAGSRGRTKVVS
jgi:hypothetical protein